MVEPLPAEGEFLESNTPRSAVTGTFRGGCSSTETEGVVRESAPMWRLVIRPRRSDLLGNSVAERAMRVTRSARLSGLLRAGLGGSRRVDG